jgi:drug/metabolite transporter (DMT)-like permease
MHDMVVRNDSRARWRIELRVLLAFGAIYVLWGGTFLAIRIAVLQIPPFFTAGVRFFTAGILLHAVMRLRGEARLSLIEWRNTAIIGLCMFVLTYGPLFWAEQYVSSSITSVIEASLPITTITLEVFVFRTQRMQWRALAGVLLGFFGIVLLLVNNRDQELAVVPCLVILAAGIAWSFGAVLSGRLALPRSRPLTAGTEMMLGGAALLALSASTGELRPLPHVTLSAGLALTYLIVCGSLIAYTAYVWLLGRMSATRVASHAYINPLVAVGLGYFLAGEVITARTVAAATLVVGSVFLILSRGPPRRTSPAATESTACAMLGD